MWSCRIRQGWVLGMILALVMLQGCAVGPKPSKAPKIDFDRFDGPVVPLQAHCPGQDTQLKETQASFAGQNYTRALTLAAEIISAPCSMENYTRAVKIAGDVFAVRKEYQQAFYYYLEGMSQAVNDQEKQMFHDRLKSVSVQLPPDQVQAMAEAANAPDLDLPGSVQAPSMRGKSDFHSGRIGVLLPLSGFYQVAGERALNGIQVAVDRMNRSGGGPFRLVVKDTRSETDGVADAVRDLEQSGVACIIGPMVTAVAAAAEAQALEVPMIALSQEPDISTAGEYVFRHFLTPERQAAALVSHVMEEYGSARFVVLYPENRYGQRFSRAFEQAADEYGGSVTAGVAYEPGRDDFSSLIRPLIRGYLKLDASRNFVAVPPGEAREKNRIYRAVIDADAVFIPDDAETAAQIALQLRFHDIRDVVLLGTNIWNPEALARVWGQAPLPVVFPVDFDPEDPAETVQDFVAAYEAVFEEPPDYFAAVGFEAAMQVMERLSDPQVTSRSELQRSLKNKGFDRGVVLQILGSGE